MKINYNNLMHSEIKGLNCKPKLVLHVCCAPCSSGVIDRLKDHFDINYFYYNPNIYPEDEYNLRASQFEKLGVKVISPNYNHSEFLTQISGSESELEGGERCKKCIEMRMRYAFQYAKEVGAEWVTTTLSISPHKDAEFINLTGEKLAKEFNVNYLHADFKKENGFLITTKRCAELNIYRQTYCGCEFSLNGSKNQRGQHSEEFNKE